MERKPPRPWVPFAILAAGLLAWAGVFAMGAYLEWGADRPRHDYRKPLIVFGAMLAFLSFWGVAFWLRSRRSTRKKR